MHLAIPYCMLHVAFHKVLQLHIITDFIHHSKNPLFNFFTYDMSSKFEYVNLTIQLIIETLQWNT